MARRPRALTPTRVTFETFAAAGDPFVRTNLAQLALATSHTNGADRPRAVLPGRALGVLRLRRRAAAVGPEVAAGGPGRCPQRRRV